MRLVRHRTVADFVAVARPYLAEREVENNLLLGLCSALEAGRYSDPYMATVHEGDDVVAVALRTPPYSVQVTDASLDALALVAESLHAEGQDLPGVGGPVTAARAFAASWRELTGLEHRVALSMRIYALTEVTPVQGVPGSFRAARPADASQLARWTDGFFQELQIDTHYENAEKYVADRMEHGELFVWERGDVVSLAAAGGPTPNGIRVNLVYTPEDLRGRGYASACVAALSQLQLDRGRTFCFLYTDLANPTSNSIYQRIGYRPVCDSSDLRFGRA